MYKFIFGYDYRLIWLIAQVMTSGVMTLFAGVAGAGGSGGNGGPASSASINYPCVGGFGQSGDVFIVDMANHRIQKVLFPNFEIQHYYLHTHRANFLSFSRKVSSVGIVSTVAGTTVAGFSGDGGPATSASLNSPSAMSWSSQRSMFIADTENHRIRMVNAKKMTYYIK